MRAAIFVAIAARLSFQGQVFGVEDEAPPAEDAMRRALAEELLGEMQMKWMPKLQQINEEMKKSMQPKGEKKSDETKAPAEQ